MSLEPVYVVEGDVLSTQELKAVGERREHKEALAMKKTFDEMAVEMQDEGLESRSEEFGDMVITHVRLPAHFDPSPMFEALPDGVCPIPHWGRVLEGEIHLRYIDGTQEVTREGDFFYWPPGHVIWTSEVGVVWMDVAPTTETRRVNELLSM